MNPFRRTSFLFRSTAPGLVLSGWATLAAACPYTIRDSGYIVTERTPYQVCFVVDGRTEGRDQVSGWVKRAAAAILAHSNLQGKVLDLSAGKEGRLYRAYEASGKPPPPAALLVSPQGNALRLAGFGPGAVSEAAVRSVLAGAATSPARRKLKAALVEPWCVLVLATGTRAGDNQQATKAVAAAVATTKKIFRDAREKRFLLPETLTLALSDPRETVFLWSLGLLDDDRSAPRVAVVFGRGRRLGAVLEGPRITARNVSRLLWLLAQNCACTSDPSWLLGPVVPLVWPRSLQARVVARLGFDPQSPGAFASLSGVWTGLAEGPSTSASDNDLGYLDFAPSTGSSATAQTSAAAPAPPSPSAQTPAAEKLETPAGVTPAPAKTPVSSSPVSAPQPTKSAAHRARRKSTKEKPRASAMTSPSPTPAKNPAPRPPALPRTGQPDTAPEVAPTEPPLPASPAGPLPPAQPSESTLSSQLNRTLVVFVGFLMVAALGAGLVLVWRRGRER